MKKVDALRKIEEWLCNNPSKRGDCVMWGITSDEMVYCIQLQELSGLEDVKREYGFIVFKDGWIKYVFAHYPDFKCEGVCNVIREIIKEIKQNAEKNHTQVGE